MSGRERRREMYDMLYEKEREERVVSCKRRRGCLMEESYNFLPDWSMFPVGIAVEKESEELMLFFFLISSSKRFVISCLKQVLYFDLPPV